MLNNIVTLKSSLGSGSKVIGNGTIREIAYEFLLVFNCNCLFRTISQLFDVEWLHLEIWVVGRLR